MKFTFEPLKISNDKSSWTIYYDATCNLCNRTINFIKRFDTRKHFDYVPLQYSEFKSEELGSVIYSENNKIYRKSDAVIRILKHLQSPVSWLYVFVFLPRFIREWLYEVVSRNRYKWFGKCENCQTNLKMQ